MTLLLVYIKIHSVCETAKSFINKIFYSSLMSCLNPISVLSPESRWLRKCRKENRSFEYYFYQATHRRNLMFDPLPLIDNPRDYYDYHFRPNYRTMEVPCGHCDACIKSKVDDLFIRCYYEMMRTLDAKNGSVWLGTLTYSDDLLPHIPLEFLPENYKGKQIPCFDKSHIQNFFKRLRKRFDRKFKDVYVTEFGGEFGRPHYHFLLFVEDFPYSESNQYRLLSNIANSWTKIEDRTADKNSMHYLGLDNMMRVDIRPVKDNNGLRYVSKYIGKQIGSENFDALDIPAIYKRFYHASIGFGDCLLDYADVDVWKQGFVMIDNYKYKIPQYYRLKMQREYFCTFDNGTICYKPSDEGLFYQWNFCMKQINECKDLARLNTDFPKPPSWVFDPSALENLNNCFQQHIFDPSYTDPLFAEFFNEWSVYLTQVRAYNKTRLDAQIQRWNDSRRDHYLKKTGRK